MIEQEQYLLGTILSYPEAIKHIGGLKPEHMLDPTHSTILEGILAQLADAQAVSPVTISARIGKEHNKYLAQLMGAANARGVADMSTVAAGIVDEYHERTIKETCANVLNGGSSLTDMIKELRVLVDESLAAVGGRKQRTIQSVTESILADMEADKVAYSTGITALDAAMGGGLYKGKAYGIAARKKVGKTIMLGTISHNLNLWGTKHLFICGEMGEKEIQQRVLCRALEMYPNAFRSGYAEKPHVMQRIKEYAKTMPNNVIYLDAPAISFDDLKQQVTMAKMKHGIEGFILDYWQLVTGKGKDSEAYFLGEVAQWIAEIGRKLDIFSITAAQINQDGNTRGGEGMRLAFDQVYHLQPINNDVTQPARWMEMMDTRYTPWANIGASDYAGLMLNEKGLFFEE